jgi:hypothetical protein
LLIANSHLKRQFASNITGIVALNYPIATPLRAGADLHWQVQFTTALVHLLNV